MLTSRPTTTTIWKRYMPGCSPRDVTRTGPIRSQTTSPPFSTACPPDTIRRLAGRRRATRSVPDRVLGGWLGRIAGCNLGKPVEDGDDWTAARIRAYLELADAYPLRDYVPALDPMPEGYRLRDCWTETTRGRVHGSARDDDIDYSILALWLLEQHGSHLTPADVATAWLSYLPYLRVFTAERAVYANLLRGLPVEAAGEIRNPYREWIGALIRADIFGWVLTRSAPRGGHIGLH